MLYLPLVALYHFQYSYLISKSLYRLFVQEIIRNFFSYGDIEIRSFSLVPVLKSARLANTTGAKILIFFDEEHCLKGAINIIIYGKMDFIKICILFTQVIYFDFLTCVICNDTSFYLSAGGVNDQVHK